MKPKLFSVVLGLLIAGLGAPVNAEPNWDQPVREIDVADFRGRVWTMADFRQDNLLVVAFLGTECPLAKLYASRLKELHEAFAEQNVAFLAVMSNRQDSIAEISAFARQHGLDFPILKDAGNRFADLLGAERTPEVFVLDRERKLRYWGRIDDQYGIGYVREAPQQHDLREAIQSLLDGNQPSPRQTRSVGCLIGRQKAADPTAEVTFCNQVARILNRRCVECHREGEIAPFALTDYEEAAGWADMIAEVVTERRMPPWHANPEFGHFANDRTLTEEELTTLVKWAQAGAPRGNPEDLPEQPEFVEGWQLPRQPDLVLNVSPTVQEIPADQPVAYRYFRVDPGFTEERWLQAAELRPGNRAVVHHILCFVRAKDSKQSIRAERSFLVGYVPGARVEPSPAGMAKRIPPNSELIFQVHYTPVGTPQTDQSTMGLIFADPEAVTHEIITSSAVQVRLRLPPHDSEYQVEATIPERLPEASLLSLSPHMHLRGKAFQYQLLHPDGQRETVLDVPAYDFNWQTTYRFSQPISLVEGTRIHCKATFDNSEENLNNPDPNVEVRWGDQTTDEMMIGYFHYAVPLGDAAPGGNSPPNERTAAAVRIFQQIDEDADERVSLDAVPARFRDAASKLDANQDGVLTLHEVYIGAR